MYTEIELVSLAGRTDYISIKPLLLFHSATHQLEPFIKNIDNFYEIAGKTPGMKRHRFRENAGNEMTSFRPKALAILVLYFEC
jgi:hypothetical protein